MIEEVYPLPPQTIPYEYMLAVKDDAVLIYEGGKWIPLGTVDYFKQRFPGSMSRAVPWSDVEKHD